MATEICTEMYLSGRLAQHGARCAFDGVTDRDGRRETIRAAIKKRGLEAVIIGRAPDKAPVTYAEYFKRVYGVEL